MEGSWSPGGLQTDSIHPNGYNGSQDQPLTNLRKFLTVVESSSINTVQYTTNV